MEKLHYAVTIDAPKEKVWHAMLDDETYRQWTEVFAKGSHYEGSWEEGSKMIFLAPDGDSTSGMVSRIKANRPYEFISIEHIGIVNKGQEDTNSDEVKKWRGAQENYIFNEKDGRTEVLVDMDSEPEYKEMFDHIWPEALRRLKDIAEVGAPKNIVVSAIVNVPVEKVWELWIDPEHIVQWAFASDDWEAPAADNDLREGGKFKIVMAAKDGSSSFDFAGTYTAVKKPTLIEYDMDDGRHVKVLFNQLPEGVIVTQIFDPEETNTVEVQREGWQSILNNFKRYAEKE